MSSGYFPKGGKMEGREYILTCPECHKPGKFSWNAEKWGHAQQGVGQCFSCGLAIEGQRSLLRLFPRTESSDTPQPGGYQQTLRKPSSCSSYIPALDDVECTEYLEGRGVYGDLTIACGALRDIATRRVCFPIYSPLPGNHPTMLMSRSIVLGEKGWRSFPGGKGNYIFGRLPPAGGEIILVEGVFDVLSSGMWGRAVALLGKTMSSSLQWYVLENYSSVVIYLDPPEICEAAEVLRLELEEKNCYWRAEGAGRTITKVYTGMEPSDHGI